MPSAAPWSAGTHDDAYLTPGAQLPAGSGDKEWELMVVKDDNVANAMASFGVYAALVCAMGC